MAEDIIVFDPSTDEEEDDKPVVAPSLRNDSSSDSEDSQPVMKKSRSTARWRSRPPLEDVSNEKPAPSIGLYSVSGKLDLKANIPDMDNTEDLDEEEKIIKLPLKNKSSKPSRAVTREKSSRIPEPDICLVDDDDDDDESDNARVNSSSSGRDRSPTPPPSLTGRHLPIARRRKARTPRGTKQAIGNLESLRCRLRTERIIDRLHMHDADNDVVVVDEGHDSQSPRKELNVKIRSVNGIRRFLMGKNESFDRVLKEMAEKEGVSEEHIVLYHKDEVIMPYNTPRLLNLTIADILDCHTIVRNADDEEEDDEDDLLDIDDPTMVRLKLRGKNKRAAAVTIRIKKTDPLEKLMREYALKCSLPFASLTFHFDGDLIARGQTAIELDMEDDDCIDVGSKES